MSSVTKTTAVVQMSSLISQADKYADKPAIDNYKKANTASRVHQGLVITGIVLAILTAIVGVGSFLALSGNLPHALNALQFLHQIPYVGSISMMAGGTLLTAIVLAVHKKRNAGLQNKCEETRKKLRAALIRKIQPQVLAILTAQKKLIQENSPELKEVIIDVVIKSPKSEHVFFLQSDNSLGHRVIKNPISYSAEKLLGLIPVTEDVVV